MDNQVYFWVFVIGVGLLGYWFGLQEAAETSRQLQVLEVQYQQLNESYTALQIDYQRLLDKQKQLSEEIASYLIEQTSIDLLGLRKYTMAYDLIKIVICNKNPSIAVC